MNTIIQIVITIALVGIAGIAGWFSMQFLELKRIQIENEARYQCAMSVRYEVADEQNNSTISYAPQDLYEKCLDEKGI